MKPILIIAVFAAIVLVGCGRSDSATSKDAASPPATAQSKEVEPAVPKPIAEPVSQPTASIVRTNPTDAPAPVLSTPPEAESTTMTQNGFRIISIRRSKEYPPPPNTMLKARDGNVFVAVAFVPVPLNSIDDFADDQTTFLVDSQGEKHGIAYTEVVGSQQLKNGKTVPEYQCLVFPMSETAKPKQMLVKTVEIDLTKIKEQVATNTAAQNGKGVK
jgi:hypothetical protein